MKGLDFANVHHLIVFQTCWTAILAADVRKILDLYTRIHMITKQYSPFLCFFKSD